MRAAPWLLLLSLGLSACGSDDGPATVEVELNSAGVNPSTLVAPSSGKVHFTNHDTVDHQIASTDCPNIASPKLAAGGDFTGPLPAGPKLCSYNDALNPSDAKFKGLLNVSAPPAGGGSGSGY